ncbi:TraB/GumN family protein [Psychroflexus sp. ALD_RP9]|uniref:TraB/GumN family protein n=1 Tax=Psychroflexus sp. ALD_RP9 TaxID=2777186 RepID=UPI001A8DC964|nr:TraB/GumN family protein [Psychroflexus sp. ALD_RP9]QSS96734.1 TraB/GumN family protein [Psychroflexus sp. ALD_RP9]
MNKMLLILVVCSSVVFNLQAQSIENALLWKVSGNGLDENSYLYGTIHLACEVKISEEVKTTFEATNQLALEINMADPAMMTTMMQNMYMADGKTLADFTTDQELKQLETFFEGKVPGMSFAMMQNIKPFFLSSMAMTSFLSCANPQGYDMYFLQQAKQADKAIIGLETLEDQLNIIDKVPYENQVDDLLLMANESLASNKKMFQDMLDFYEAKDLQGLMNFMNKQESSMNLYAEDFLDHRNKKWISVITEVAKEKSTFFAFGAAHLAGENGVVNLLRKAGFTVEAIQ